MAINVVSRICITAVVATTTANITANLVAEHKVDWYVTIVGALWAASLIAVDVASYVQYGGDRK